MDQRKYPRLKTKMMAEINNNQAFLENVSREGIKMKIWSDAVPRTRDVEIALSVGKQTINLRGIVCWCKRDKNSYQDLKEVGLYLQEPPDEYYRFIDSLSNQRAQTVQI
ncbi:MAG: PilZ domain-containing protein [Candidatus Aminicenantes bacterium]|nr:PilZ domain-containing protein [Candidatus Aminicenantes bacterium]